MLLTKENVLKLADFGLAKVLIGTTGKSVVGTQPYWSPELDKCRYESNITYSFPNDIWLGLLIDLFYLIFV